MNLELDKENGTTGYRNWENAEEVRRSGMVTKCGEVRRGAEHN